jgi:hypothetical protein
MGAGGGIESYYQAVKQIDNLTKVDPKNLKAEEFITSIDSVLLKYNDPIEDWLVKNSSVRPQIEKGFPGLYARLFKLERYLSFDDLRGIGELDLCLLAGVYDLINKFSDIDEFVRRCRSCAKIYNYAAK